MPGAGSAIWQPWGEPAWGPGQHPGEGRAGRERSWVLVSLLISWQQPAPCSSPTAPALETSNFLPVKPNWFRVSITSAKSVCVSCSVMSNSLQPHGARQAPLSMGFFRQEYWSGLPFPSPGDLPNQGIELRCPASQADSLLSEPPGKPLAKST